MAGETNEDGDPGNSSKPFLSGVVEGFYGRPWTLAQRKDLFQKMQSWGMTSYLYAPKDDCKHRAFWRELYTVEEADHLQSLITAAHDCNVDFYYAISPGLDITYSNSKEVSTLKRKLDQVAQLGCKAFALLFDDIEAEMSKPDKEAFQSFAHAQVSVTNEIYHHLGQPKFLFCPTQYCTARAVPTIATSEYLKTIGSKLPPDIDIMWTGDKVIPKDITVTSLEEITQVLRRPPVIWDNEHANDYDQKRLYLGPYSGRSPDIIPKLRGVMANPNCEYGANFVAVHSLAHWSKCTVDGCSGLAPNDAVTADIKLELATGPGDGPEDKVVPPPPPSLPPHVYHPRRALREALQAWILEFSKPKMMWGPITKPQVGLNPAGIIQPSINTCMTSTSTTSSVNSPLLTAAPEAPSPKPPDASAAAAVPVPDPRLASPYTVPQPFSPVVVPVMNSLVATHHVILERPGPEPGMVSSNGPAGSQVTSSPTAVDIKSVAVPEPMDIHPDSESGSHATSPNVTQSEVKQADEIMESNTNPPTPASGMQVEPADSGGGLTKAESTTMLCDPGPVSPDTSQLNHSHNEKVEGSIVDHEVSMGLGDVGGVELSAICQESVINGSGELTVCDLELLCDLFYLPCEHGPKGLELLNEFYWLKTNAGVMLSKNGGESCESNPEVCLTEWIKRREQFNNLVSDIRRVFEKICNCQNRELVYNLYTYLWDLVGVAHMLKSYIDWLSLGHFSPKFQQLIIGRHTWFSGIREAFQSGDHEPWVFRGGLTADLQRLMPVDSGNDLFVYKYPDCPVNSVYVARSYRPEDEDACYRIAMQTWDDGMDASSFYTSHPRLIGDKIIGPFLNFSPEHAIVCENNSGEIVGYLVTAPNLKEFLARCSVAWLPEVRSRYPKVEKVEGELMTPCELTINSLHEELQPLPPSIDQQETWAFCRMSILPSVLDASISRRATMLMLACLRSSGALKVLTEVPKKERYMQELYTKLGFSPLLEGPDCSSDNTLYMFRRY